MHDLLLRLVRKLIILVVDLALTIELCICNYINSKELVLAGCPNLLRIYRDFGVVIYENLIDR